MVVIGRKILEERKTPFKMSPFMADVNENNWKLPHHILYNNNVDTKAWQESWADRVTLNAPDNY